MGGGGGVRGWGGFEVGGGCASGFVSGMKGRFGGGRGRVWEFG